ncbi:MAG: hypothetical protein SFV51_00965 [Bryobacteraceae bacterium]|nr:hypothetical protein [Bryobacteraceae bacterium]
MAGIVGYASLKMGDKVGDGQCVRLVEAALTQAGKKTTKDLGISGHTADYVWGTLVASHSSGSLDAVLPGDIVQFRDHVMTVTTSKKNGGSAVATHSRAHHTAIIASKGYREDDYNRKYYLFSIIEQNYKGVKTVVKSKVQFQKSDIKLDNGDEVLTESNGSFWIYRPVNL